MSVDCEDKSTFWKIDASLQTLMDIFGADRIVDTQVVIAPTCIGQILSCSYVWNLPVYVTICSVLCFFFNHTYLSFPLLWGGKKCEGKCATSSCKRQPTVCNMYEPF